jgi:FHS family L-fucose permease-like MFS transporter
MSMVTGLLIMAAGALGMMLAASIPSYGVTLVMLFVIASGITLLQVAANPYVAVVGPAETASSRLTLVQALNSAGTMLAPLFGAYLILGRSKSGTAVAGTVLTPAERLADAHSVILPYGLVAACWWCWPWSSRAIRCPPWAARPAAWRARSASIIRCGRTATWCSAFPRSSST